jgi:hypothetical protein
MYIHSTIYLAISIVYVVAAVESFGGDRYRSGWGETIIALLYGALALITLDPCFMQICTLTA